MRVPSTVLLEGARRVIDHARPRLARTLAVGVLCAGSSGIACSSSAIGAGPADEQGSTPNAGETPDETDDAPLDPREPGASVFCGMGGKTGKEPEIYMLYAMNRKLQMYPEFAAAAGLSLVSDCDGGRRYSYEYAKYRLEHGEFDADQELGELPDETRELPSSEPPRLEMQKIHNGYAATNDAVVRINFQIPDGTDPAWKLGTGNTTCTGTFINKNWILTAAHCLTFGAVIKCLRTGKTPAQCQPSWTSYGKYTISGTRQGRDYTVSNVFARHYVHADWTGRDPNKNPYFCPGAGCLPDDNADHDLGLLYLSQAYDDQLHPSVEEGAAMRLSIAPPDKLWPNDFYGYGNSNYENPGLLSGGQRTIKFFTKHTIVAGLTTVEDPFLCRGDSGGPLVRTDLSLVTNLSTNNQVVTGLEAVFGVASQATGADCKDLSSTAGAEDIWTRVDAKSNRKFIEETLRRWQPYTNLTYTRRPLGVPPDPPPQPPFPPQFFVVEELWGKPCADQSFCKKDAANKKYIETCWHAPDYFATRNQTSCEACGPSSNCECIVGQCIPITP